MKLAIKIVILCLAAADLVASAVLLAVAISATDAAFMGVVAAVCLVAPMVCTAVLLLVSFVFISDRTMRAAFFVSLLAAALLVASAVIVFRP